MKLIRIAYIEIGDKTHKLTYSEDYGVNKIEAEVAALDSLGGVDCKLKKIETYNLISTKTYTNERPYQRIVPEKKEPGTGHESINSPEDPG